MDVSHQHSRTRIRFLTTYSLLVTLVLGGVGGASFAGSRARAKFDVIDVERINIVEPDGRLRMVISNRPRSVGPIYKGKPFARPGGDRPGMIFFNDEGTENGGLTFTGMKDSLGRVSAGTHMSFDQFNQDQVLNLDYAERGGRRTIGMTINDRADVDILDLSKEIDSIQRIADTSMRSAALSKLAMTPRNGIPLNAPRLFAGRDAAKSSIVSLNDRSGRPRLRLLVDSTGNPRIEFLNDAGQVIRTLSER